MEKERKKVRQRLSLIDSLHMQTNFDEEKQKPKEREKDGPAEIYT